MHAPREDRTILTFVLMEVSQIFLVGEDDCLILGNNLPPEALPARGQLPQLFQLTYSVNKTHTSGHRADSPPLELQREHRVQEEQWCSVGQASSYTASLKAIKQPDTGCWERSLSPGEAHGGTLQELGKC